MDRILNNMNEYSEAKIRNNSVLGLRSVPGAQSRNQWSSVVFQDIEFKNNSFNVRRSDKEVITKSEFEIHEEIPLPE